MKSSRALEKTFLVCCFSMVAHLSHSSAIVTSKAALIAQQNNSRYVQDIVRLSKAAEIRSYMNESVDPCDNFYEFACGNWAKINPSRKNQGTGKYLELQAAYDRKIEIMLNTAINASDTALDKKIKELYQSCINFDRRSAKYREKLREILREFGEMPALSGAAGDDWNEDKFDWLETIAKISHKYGKAIVFEAYLDKDLANNTIKRFYVSPPSFPLAKAIYVDDLNKEYFQKYVLEIKTNLKQYLELEDKTAEEIAKAISEFERKLANGRMDLRHGLDANELFNLTTIEELQQKYAPTIDIRKYFNISWEEVPQAPIYEEHEQYFQNLIYAIAETPIRTVANYIFYELLVHFEFWSQQLPREITQAQLCVDVAKEHFDTYLENMVYRSYNISSNEIEVMNMWKELKSTFKAALLTDRLDWIKLATRQHAIEKLDNMKLFVNSYQEKNFTQDVLGVVTIGRSDWIENLKNIRETTAKRSIAAVHEPVETSEDIEGDSFNPFYVPSDNIIRIPVSLLQPYHFWADVYPNALKFSTLGSIIGHELFHGFDDGGRKYDMNGNLQDWWDESSATEFVERTKCFTAQYRKYRYGGRYLADSVEQSENIADNGGVRLAYAAYQQWYADAVVSGQSLRLEFLPNMKYTRQQLFFLSFAQVWCSDQQKSEQVKQTVSDVHTPDSLRVIGTMSNMAEFAEEFSCAPGTSMNPARKCIIY